MADKKEKKEKNPKKIIVIVLIVILALGAAGAGGWYFVLRNKDNESVVRKVEEEFYKLGDFTVNLADDKKQAFIRASIVIGYEKNEKAVEELDKYNAKIRDAVNMLLLTKKSEEVKEVFGIEQLKRQIKIRIDSIVDTVSITDVYFNEIAIQ